ncbi:MAG: carboxypeptidase regulatory-like domain-containing protein [Myxococcota bacterium]
MVSRGAIIAVLLVLAGVLIYWALGRDSAPAPEPPTPVEAKQAGPAAKASGSRTARASSPIVTTHALRGRAESAGKPVAGAVITVVAAGAQADEKQRHTARTDASGQFEVSDVEAGRYAVSATADGLLPVVQRGVEVPSTGPLTLVLEAGGHPLRGTVSDATGGSVEGALVRLTPLAGVASLRRLDGFGTMSSDEGDYVVHVEPGRYRVEVSHADYATEHRTVEVGPGAQSQDFALVPMGVIEGVVRQDDGGEAVPGALVTWQRERQVTLVPGQRMSMPAGGGTVRADAEGRFRIQGLSPGAVTVQARVAGWVSDRPTVVPLAMAEHVTDADVFVIAAHDLRGRVVASDDPERGISGAEVQLLDNERFSPRARTDADGNFVLPGVLPGSVTVMASADGYLPSMPGTTVQAGPDAPELTLTLNAAPTIVGRVEPPTVAQVSIELRPETMQMGMGGGGGMIFAASGGASVETDGDGNFELGPAMPGPRTLVARVADGRAGEVTVEVGPDGAKDVVIRLEQRATLSGVVRNASGAAVAQANVSLRPKQGPGEPTMRLTVNGRDMGSEMGTSTADGRFEIGGIAAGEHEIQVVDRYGEPLPLLSGPATVTVAEGRDRDDLNLVVDAHDGVIRGVVSTADGAPVPDVWVHAALLPEMAGLGPEPPPEGEGPSQHSEMRMIVADDGGADNGRPPVLTDEDGRFEVTGLRDARYELAAESSGGRERVTAIARPGQDVALALAELGRVEGQVTLDGQPLKSYAVRVEGPTARGKQVRDSAGHFELERLDPGTYQLVVTAPDGSGRAEVTVGAGESVTKDVVLEHKLTVRGRIVDEAGQPVPGAMILVGEGAAGQVSIEQTGDEAPLVTDEDGRFELNCAAGPRALVALSPGSPKPLVVHFFVAQPGQDVDLGELKAEPMEGAVMEQHDVEVAE